MDLLDIVVYCAVAAMGGAINSVAGGGTFLVFPMLIFGGLTPIQANVTSTIALWPGSVTSALTYRTERIYDRKTLIPLMVASILGGVCGTLILLGTPESTFSALVPWLLLSATLLFTFGKYIIRHPINEPTPGPRRKITGWLLQFAIAVYGGYFGAGIGILMLAMLQVIGYSEIHLMNGLKSFLGSTINAVAVVIFIFSGKVVWPVALVLIIGAITGGYLGTRLAFKIPPHKIRWLVSAIGFSMSAYFFLYGV